MTTRFFEGEGEGAVEGGGAGAGGKRSSRSADTSKPEEQSASPVILKAIREHAAQKKSRARGAHIAVRHRA